VNDFGLDAELAAKANAKYDPALEATAMAWIEELVEGADFSKGFGPALQDGVMLCKLVNALQPGTIKVYEGGMTFKKMENVSMFIRSARGLGVPESDLFTTVSLFELKDLGQVVTTILALKRVTKDGKDVKAPADKAALLKADKSFRSGSLASRMTNKSETRVNETNRAGFVKSQTRPDASISKLNMGSSGVMDATIQTRVNEANRAEFAKRKSLKDRAFNMFR